MGTIINRLMIDFGTQFLIIEAFYDYEIRQMDVKIIFLSGYYKKDIHMEQSKGFTFNDGDYKVYKL